MPDNITNRIRLVYSGKKKKGIFPFSAFDNENQDIYSLDNDIDKQKVDAYINPTDRDLTCFTGENSSIFYTAGSAYTDFCKQKSPVEPGVAFITGGYDLPCRWIIHLTGPKPGENNRIEKVEAAFRDCFTIIDQKGLKTIAMPSFAWNTYYVSFHEIAPVVMRTIKSFLQKNTTLECFTIVCASDYFFNYYRLLMHLPSELVPYLMDFTDERMNTYWQLRERLAKSIGKIEKMNNKLEQAKKTLEQQKEEITAQRDEIEIQKDELDRKNQAILADIKAAERIQKAVLPKKEYINRILPEHFIFYKPQSIVSGDFYWLRQIQQFTVVVAADCTGHGVPGALMSMLGIAFLNEIVNKINTLKPNQILNELRDEVKKALQVTKHHESMKEGMDIALCVLNNENNILQYAGAYNPIYLIRNNELHNIKADKQPIAIHLREKEFTNNKIELQKNDVIYMFSDGFQDQFGGLENKKLMSKNFKQILTDIHHEPMEKQKILLQQKFDYWKQDNEQIDDVLVMGFRV